MELECILKVLWERYRIAVFLGIEIEFYSNLDVVYSAESSEVIVSGLSPSCMSTRKFDLIGTVKKEISARQYEMVTRVSSDVSGIISEVECFRHHLMELESKNNIGITFSAKPFNELSGSAMHVNLTFYECVNNEVITQKHCLFESILSGMCSFMRNSMLYFAPDVESYERFRYADLHTPSFINWGFNNRSVAIRVVSGMFRNFRIEHRVSGADANVYDVVCSIISASAVGIKNKLKNAVLEFGVMRYNENYMHRLPMTFTEAKRYHKDFRVCDI